MQQENRSFEQVRQLADKHRMIMANWKYVWFLGSSPPGSLMPWPDDRLPYTTAELDSHLKQPDHLEKSNPYTQYDEWFLERCGPDGYTRAGDMIGIRDQSKAEEFLRWIFPGANEHTVKVNLARMMAGLPCGLFDQAVETIGDSLLNELSAIHIAALAVRIEDSWQHVRRETELDLAADA